MEHTRFSALSRNLRSRRTAIGSLALIAGTLTGHPQAALSASRKRNPRCPKTHHHQKCGKNKKCVNTLTHLDHCGSCNSRCEEGVDCINGVCGGPVEPA